MIKSTKIKKVVNKKPVQNATKNLKSKPADKLFLLDKPHVKSHELFLNRELGWLEFNQRVLAQAQNSQIPLLERAKFLSIVNSNLDEFFMKRVGGLKRALDAGTHYLSSDGLSPKEELNFVRKRVKKMIKDQGHAFNKLIKPALRSQGIVLIKWNELRPKDKDYLNDYFKSQIFPVLTPLVVDPAHPFPYISNLSTSLGVRLEHPKDHSIHFARIKVPEMLDQWVMLPKEKSKQRFISVVELIKENLTLLFSGMKILSVMPFRITRNVDLGKDSEDAEDLLEHVVEELQERKFADVVRLEHGPLWDKETLEILKNELEFSWDDIYELPEEWDLDYNGLKTITKLSFPDLKFSEFKPLVPHPFYSENPEDIFHRIRSSDVLLHHPYESFSDSVAHLIALSSEDPQCLAIKITLYRTEQNSPIIKALKRALALGKQVVVLIELKARFDEERNILWAQELEKVGAHVLYGIVGLKIHTKICLIVRKEEDQVVSYAHIGTGNYNSLTSNAYTDFSLITAKEEVTLEIKEVFNYLTGISTKQDYGSLLVAPVNMNEKFLKLIARERKHALAGKPAQMIAKMNNFEESNISKSFYRASQDGVQIDLLIRGFCCLRPQRKHLSENIKVRSIIGRFLEHSRIYYFRNGQADPAKGDFYIGSADLMYRNLFNRVECIVPILDSHLKSEIWTILQFYLSDESEHWVMCENGDYVKNGSSDLSNSLHAKLISRYNEREMIIDKSQEAGQPS